MSDTWVRCVNCANHSILFGRHWCDGRKKSLRLTAEDAIKDAPCTYYKPKEVKANETN